MAEAGWRPTVATYLGRVTKSRILEAVREATSPLSFAIVDTPRPGQVAVLHDDLGIPTLVHLADAEADARSWLAAHPRDNVRLVPAEALEPRTFTYLMDPGHGWLIVSRGDLAGAGLSPADFSECSYVRGDTLALEEDCDMPRFLKRLDERGIAYRLREQHTNGDAYVRHWACNTGAAAASG